MTTDARVILVTVTGPSGKVDLGVRADATTIDLATQLRQVLGLTTAALAVEHLTPPRPGGVHARRTPISPGSTLGAVGVADGDVISFREVMPGRAEQTRSSTR
jgi:hypothetical protein